MNRRRTDFAGTEVECTVSRDHLPTVIKFDHEHMPAEPEAGYMSDSWTIGDMFLRLTPEIFLAIDRLLGDCISLHVDGHAITLGCELEDLEFCRGYWRLRSSDLEDALAMHMSDLDRERREEMRIAIKHGELYSSTEA